MQIDTMTMRDVLDRMGFDASDAEAVAMLRILRKSEHDDTDQITDTAWRTMICSAIRKASSR